MSKTECKMRLKHQLDISRRLQQLGMFAAAAEARLQARVLLHAYKRHLSD